MTTQLLSTEQQKTTNRTPSGEETNNAGKLLSPLTQYKICKYVCSHYRSNYLNRLPLNCWSFVNCFIITVQYQLVPPHRSIYSIWNSLPFFNFLSFIFTDLRCFYTIKILIMDLTKIGYTQTVRVTMYLHTSIDCYTHACINTVYTHTWPLQDVFDSSILDSGWNRQDTTWPMTEFVVRPSLSFARRCTIASFFCRGKVQRTLNLWSSNPLMNHDFNDVVVN